MSRRKNERRETTAMTWLIGSIKHKEERAAERRTKKSKKKPK